MKQCTKCWKAKPLAEFPKDKKYKDGLDYWCRDCCSEYSRAYRLRKENRIRLLAKSNAYVKAYYRRSGREYIKNKTKAIRQEIIKAYGGKCSCECGCTTNEYEFLAIDHVSGGGSMERKRPGNSGMCLYVRIKKLGFPQDKYRILCHNCNQSKGYYGYCPRERSQV